MSQEKVKKEKFQAFDIVIAHDEKDIVLTASKDGEVVASAVVMRTGLDRCWLSNIQGERGVIAVEKYGDVGHGPKAVTGTNKPLVVTWLVKRAVEEAKKRGWKHVEYGHKETGHRTGRGTRIFGTRKKKVKRKPL